MFTCPYQAMHVPSRKVSESGFGKNDSSFFREVSEGGFWKETRIIPRLFKNRHMYILQNHQHNTKAFKTKRNP
jgi:hypothetical protein